jgi:uncharacterized protein DUF6893
MRTLGVFTTLVLGGVAVSGLWLAVQSWPDIQRYMRIRSM